MENTIHMTGRKGAARISKGFLFLFILSSLNFSSLSAQDNGPSLDNLKSNAKAIDAETQRIKEKERHDEILSYVYMSVGFAIVIAIAWVTTVMARNRSKKEAEEKHRFIMRQQELKKQHGHHSPGHGHGHLHKAKR